MFWNFTDRIPSPNNQRMYIFSSRVRSLTCINQHFTYLPLTNRSQTKPDRMSNIDLIDLWFKLPTNILDSSKPIIIRLKLINSANIQHTLPLGYFGCCLNGESHRYHQYHHHHQLESALKVQRFLFPCFDRHRPNHRRCGPNHCHSNYLLFL